MRSSHRGHTADSRLLMSSSFLCLVSKSAKASFPTLILLRHLQDSFSFAPVFQHFPIARWGCLRLIRVMFVFLILTYSLCSSSRFVGQFLTNVAKLFSLLCVVSRTFLHSLDAGILLIFSTNLLPCEFLKALSGVIPPMARQQSAAADLGSLASTLDASLMIVSIVFSCLLFWPHVSMP